MFYPTEGFSSKVSGRSFHNGGHPAMVLVMALCFRLLALKSAGPIWSFSFGTSASDSRWRCRPLRAAAAAGDSSAAISDCAAGHRQAAARRCATPCSAMPAMSWPKPAAGSQHLRVHTQHVSDPSKLMVRTMQPAGGAEDGREWEDSQVVTGVAYSSAALGDRVATADLTVRSCLQSITPGHPPHACCTVCSCCCRSLCSQAVSLGT